MAQPTLELVTALRRTTLRLKQGAHFRWTHMGACVLGNLAQTVTRLSAEQIHRAALQKAGDWGQQAYDYCPTSGLPMDHIMSTLVDLGLNQDDIHHLERLSDPRVLRQLGITTTLLCRQDRNDVVAYLTAMADMLEQQREPQVMSA